MWKEGSISKFGFSTSLASGENFRHWLESDYPQSPCAFNHIPLSSKLLPCLSFLIGSCYKYQGVNYVSNHEHLQDKVFNSEIIARLLVSPSYFLVLCPLKKHVQVGIQTKKFKVSLTSSTFSTTSRKLAPLIKFMS